MKIPSFWKSSRKVSNEKSTGRTVQQYTVGSRVPTNAGFLGVFSQSQFQSQSGDDVSKYVIRCGMILCEMHYNWPAWFIIWISSYSCPKWVPLRGFSVIFFFRILLVPVFMTPLTALMTVLHTLYTIHQHTMWLWGHKQHSVLIQ